MPTLSVRTWSTPTDHGDWPELSLPEIAARAPIGLCFSGGGARALAASWGQLRALHALGVLQRVRWISAVSGGSWACGIYALQRRVDDRTLLGVPTEPGDLTLAGLSAELDSTSLGFAATQDVWGGFKKAIQEHGFSPTIWSEAVGAAMLQPYGLFNLHEPEGVAASDAHAEEILSRPGNQAIGALTLRAPPPGRPFLIVNAVVLGPTAALPLAYERPIPIEFTPFYSGISAYQNGVFRRSEGYLHRLGDALLDRHEPSIFVRPLGGWFAETFAAGAGPAALLPGLQDLPAPERPWSLADALGASSAAYAGALEGARLLARLDQAAPQMDLWPGWAWGVPQADRFALGDGGILENFGVPALLRRGARTLWVFINTAVSLSLDWDPASILPDSDVIDEYLPALFGYPLSSIDTATSDDLMLDPGGFVPLVQALQERKRAGQAVIARGVHRVLPNPLWGLRGGDEVEIFWVYLERIPRWEAKLEEEGLRLAVERGTQAHLQGGPLRGFPHYRTAEENPGKLTALTSLQARALAELACWGVMQFVAPGSGSSGADHAKVKGRP